MQLHCRPVVTEYISYKMPFLIVTIRFLNRRPLMSDNIIKMHVCQC